jgi:DNA-binding GntR family transcriptional regulator
MNDWARLVFWREIDPLSKDDFTDQYSSQREKTGDLMDGSPTSSEGRPVNLRLRQLVFDQLKKEIINCTLAPGEPLSEALIAERFKVSKTPVREALTSLQQSDLVEYRVNKGFSVATVTLKDIQDIFEARVFFECELLKLAIIHITEAEIQELERNLDMEFDEKDPESIDRCVQANKDFHLGIARASRNSRLFGHYVSILEEAQRLTYIDLKNEDIIRTWKLSHSRFVDALRNKDEQAGVQAVIEVMENQKKRILGI